jgi:hypothetical protein
METQFFLSYSRIDSAFAVRLVRDLKAHGISVWLDQLDIAPGVNWDEEIEGALGRAQVVLAVLSQHSAASDNVKNEISRALELKKQVVPVVLSKSAVPLMITRLQREDFTGDYQIAFKKLLLRLGGAGRTASLEAITPEEVRRISAESAERLHANEQQAREGAALEVYEGGQSPLQGSLSPAVAALPSQPPRFNNRRLYARAAAGLLLLAGAVGVTLAALPGAPASTPPTVAAAMVPPMASVVPPVPMETTVVENEAPAPQPSAAPPAHEARTTAPEGKPKVPPPAPLVLQIAGVQQVAGTWIGNTGPAVVTQNGTNLEVRMSGRSPATGTVHGYMISVHFSDDDGCCTGSLSLDHKSIAWSNGTGWRRQVPAPAPAR